MTTNTTIKGVGEAREEMLRAAQGLAVKKSLNLLKAPTQELVKEITKETPTKSPSRAKKASKRPVIKGSKTPKQEVRIKHLGKKELARFLVDNPKMAAELELVHHKYVGKQACNQARAIRKRLRRQGIYLSKLGHFGPRHD